MNEQIKKYIEEELKIENEKVVADVFEKITRYDDICNEFLKWLEQRNFEFDDPIVVEGYTAKDIKKLAPFMEGIGVYNFLITLREKPGLGKRFILEGFPVL